MTGKMIRKMNPCEFPVQSKGGGCFDAFFLRIRGPTICDLIPEDPMI